VPGTHRNPFPRPFVIRDADFNRTLANCSTGAKHEAEALYTATVFVGLQLNRSHEFLEEHQKTPGRLETIWRSAGSSTSASTNFCWPGWTLSKVCKETLKLKPWRKFNKPESAPSLVEDLSLPRRTRSTYQPTQEPRLRRRHPESQGAPTTVGVQLQQEGRRILPNRRTPSLSRPVPTGSNGLAPFSRVAAHAPKWQQIGASPTLLRKIKYGVLLPWTGQPRLGVRREYPLSPED
jgi:hypothetical protein